MGLPPDRVNAAAPQLSARVFGTPCGHGNSRKRTACVSKEKTPNSELTAAR
jgi:hypothetical protein